MQAPIITLVTDWGMSDFFAGMFKGHLLRALPEARIVDIAHDIAPFSTFSALPVVRHACPAFPEGTIHIIDVNSGTKCDYIAARCDGQYYICADTGLLFNAFGYRCDEAVRLPMPEGDPRTFVADTLFLPTAVMLAQGTPLSALGEPWHEKEGPTRAPYQEENQKITVDIAFFDHYGNAYLDITRKEFDSICQGRDFVAVVGDAVLRTIRTDFIPPAPGEEDLTLIESCTGQLQVAVCQDQADKLLSLKYETKVTFKFVS